MVVGNQATRKPQVLGLTKSTTTPHRICKCASLQRSMTVKHNLYTTRAVSGTVGTQRQRLQLRMDGEQSWWTPTVPTATPPSQDAPQCTGESRSVREDFHTLPQSVRLSTAWDSIVPNFDLALATTIGTLQSTNSSDKLFGSKSSARQLTTNTKCSASCPHAQTALTLNSHAHEHRVYNIEDTMPQRRFHILRYAH